jgi:hypothetical protein
MASLWTALITHVPVKKDFRLGSNFGFIWVCRTIRIDRQRLFEGPCPIKKIV